MIALRSVGTGAGVAGPRAAGGGALDLIEADSAAVSDVAQFKVGSLLMCTRSGRGGGRMEARLRPLNAVLGLVSPHDVNPARLAEAGFSLEGLEIPVVGGSGKVVIDVVLFNSHANLLVAIEAKSGANIEVDQAKRYAEIDAVAVVQAANISVGRRGPLRLQVAYACNASHVDRIRLGLSAAGVAFPVIAIGSADIQLHSVSNQAPELGEAFMPIVPLVAPPTRYISFDAESPPESATSRVRAELVAALSHQRPQVSMPFLAEQAAPHCSLYGQVARNKLVKVVAEAARRVASEDPNTFEFVAARGNDPAVVKLLRTPEGLDPRGRTQSYQALARGGRPSRRRTQQDPSQLDLLSTLDDADDDLKDDEEGESQS